MNMIETKYGKIEGVNHGWYTEYLGVPYAKPPVGELRWKAPQPMEAYEGVYQAVRFPSKAMQGEGSVPPWDKDFYDDPNYIPKASEDCLYLNIWTLPKVVMMWFLRTLHTLLKILINFQTWF